VWIGAPLSIAALGRLAVEPEEQYRSGMKVVE